MSHLKKPIYRLRRKINQVQEKEIYTIGNRLLIVYPGAKISFDFIRPISIPPHTEDFIFERDSIRFEGRATEREWKDLLHKTSHQTFRERFSIIGGSLCSSWLCMSFSWFADACGYSI
jgi:hypothetical protein